MRKFRLLLLLLTCVTTAWAAAPDFEIPEMRKYTSAEECKADNELVAKTSRYFFTTNFLEDGDYALSAIRFVLAWVDYSDEILVSVSEQTTGAFLSCKNKNLRSVLLGSYICGCALYNRDVKTSNEFTFDMHYYALEATLRYYEKNKEYFGNCQKIDKMLKSLNKGKLRKEQERLFAVNKK